MRGYAKQVSDPDYHSENHTAAQTCGWTANALRGEDRCYKKQALRGYCRYDCHRRPRPQIPRRA